MADSHSHSSPHDPGWVLRTLMQTETREIRAALSFGVALGFLTLVVPIGVQTLVNMVSLGSISDPVLFLLMAVFAGLCLNAWMVAFQERIIERMERRLFSRTALETAWRVPRRVSAGQSGNDRTIGLIHRFFDVVNVQKQSHSLLVDGFALVMQTGIGLVLLAFYHPILLAFSLLLIGSGAAIIFGLGRGAVDTAVDESTAKYSVADWLAEISVKPGLFLSERGRELALRETDRRLTGYLETKDRHFRIHFRQLVALVSLQAVASTLLLGLGGWLVVKEQLSLGQLVAAELMMTAILQSMSKVHKQLVNFYSLTSSAYKLGKLLDLPLEREGGETPPPSTGPARLRLEKAGYRFDDKERSGVSEISLEVQPGRPLAVLGGNGSGKSTLAELMGGMRDPAHGRVLLDGRDSRDFKLGHFRERVKVLRSPQTLAGTVLENLAFGSDEVTTAEARDALRRFGLLDVVEALPERLQTTLDDFGRPLSRSQVARLALARIFLQRPQVLVLDETLDELDGAAAEDVYRAVSGPDAPWSLALLTNKEDVAKLCPDRVRLPAMGAVGGGG